MSRIGRTPIEVPAGVDIKIDTGSIEVKGPKGALTQELPEMIAAEMDGTTLTLTRNDEERESRALHGLMRSLVNNMVLGVSEGFRKDLEIVGVGYRVQSKGKNLEFQLGFSHPVKVEAPDGIEFNVEEQTKFSVLGVDKQKVGQVAAEIRDLKKPEPYKGKGIRYVGEHVRRKAGKAVK